MNTYNQINTKVMEFCQQRPSVASKGEYLKKAVLLYRLYIEAMISSDGGVEESEELNKIYKKICDLVD